MINNSNNGGKPQDLQGLLNGLLGGSANASDDVKKLIGSLKEDDIRKIATLIGNQELQKIAASIIESQKRKE